MDNPQVAQGEFLEWITWAFNIYPALSVLIGAIALDVLTGLSAALVAKRVTSAASWRGMLRKVIMLFIVAFAALLQLLEQFRDFPLAGMVCLCFTVTEGISIAENAALAGVKMPDVLRERLKVLHDSEKHPTDSDADLDVVEATVVVKKDAPISTARAARDIANGNGGKGP